MALKISKQEWVNRFNIVYATIGDYFLKCSWCIKEYWSWEAANVMEGLVAMYRVTGDTNYLTEVEKHITFVLDTQGDYWKQDSNYTSNVFSPIVKFARLVTEDQLTQFYSTRDRIITFFESTVVPEVLTSMKEFSLDGISMITIGTNGPIPFNQQDQTFNWLMQLSFIVNKPQYRDLFVKYANFVKWSRTIYPTCFNSTKQTYSLPYRMYTGLPWDTTSGQWCSDRTCTMHTGYANSHVDFVMEGFFHSLGFNQQDVDMLANGFVYGKWNQDSAYPLLARELGGCGNNLAPYNDWHIAYETGDHYDFSRLGTVSTKVLEIMETITDILYQAGLPTNRWWTKVYNCVPMADGGTSCYQPDHQEQPDWMLRHISNILVTAEGLPPGPGPQICVEGAIRCNGNNREQCVNNNWVVVETCAYGCANGTCLPPTTTEPVFTELYATPSPVEVGKPFTIIGTAQNATTIYMSGPNQKGLNEHQHNSSFTHPNITLDTPGDYIYYFDAVGEGSTTEATLTISVKEKPKGISKAALILGGLALGTLIALAIAISRKK